MLKKFLILLIVLMTGVLAYYIFAGIGSGAVQTAEKPKQEEKKIELAVIDGDVFNTVGERGGLNAETCYNIYNSVKDVYDLAKLHVGNKFWFYPNAQNKIVKIVYAVNDEEELTILRGATDADWTAKLADIKYDIKEKIIEGEVSNSLYLDALNKGGPDSVIVQFAENLEYNLDFAYDQRQGDKFKFIYEERYRDGKYVMPGKLLAGAYSNNGKVYQTYYFEESAENKGYFDENGNAVQKMFLKSPVSYKYISSKFTNGKRYIDAFEVSTSHKAVDYAATYGTPIRAVGSGTVTFAGRSGGYGNFTKIKHNGTYSTHYAHQSKILVKKGQHVEQGEIIGYVGSTGFSTGPHLHFEMAKDGVLVDPARVILPPGKPISETRMPDFKKAIAVWKEKISLK